jgi:predicted DNA-binding antitoxin AbrB/MazE fold protein
MPVIEAVYENGVFRPVTPVPAELRAGDRVIVAPANHRDPESPGASVLEILGRRYRSGVADTAARHDEHQP